VARERLNSKEEVPEESTTHMSDVGDPIVGPELGSHDVQNHQADDERPCLDGYRDGEDDQLGIRPEDSEGHGDSEHSPRGSHERPDGHDASQQQGEYGGPDAAKQVIENEVAASQPALDPGTKDKQHQHVGQ
jgi:hypothetical protein